MTMVIGQEDQKCCPACNSDATWQNRDTAWLIRCPMCETFLIRNSTIEILRSDVVYRTLASDLLKQEGGCDYMLTRGRLANFAKTQLPKSKFQEYFPGDNYE
ncbi:hypothetical protein C3448_05585 [Escherichia coli]|nr:hypothetical protein [Escherichia coli]ROW46814.1 hypothetical protein C3448_05585 [Escherichia coli]